MFSHSITLFTLFGFKVRLDASWFIIAFLVTWSLAKGFFPGAYEGLPVGVYWWMGAAGAVGLFISIVLHEFSHSIVARRFGMPIKGITLFIFGGVAEMDDEPPSAKSEFFMAAAGPVASIIIGGIFFGLHSLGKTLTWPVAMNGVFGYLGWINWVLAIFNLVPAFPLDGGRILRSALWQMKKNIQWATRITSNLGSAFGFLLIFFGILFFISGAFVGGLWWVLIGMFLNSAAQMSYKQLLITQAFEGESIRRFMKENPVHVSPSVTIDRFVRDYLYHYYYKMFPVTDNGHLQGCVSTKEIKEIPKERWHDLTVRDVTQPCDQENSISPETDPVKALRLMNKTGNGRLVVVDHGKLAGIVTLKDMLRFLALKMDLEGEDVSRLPLIKE